MLNYDEFIDGFLFPSETVGHTSNYAVVVAQLYTKGQCHGIHPFIVQLRDEETWAPMKGKIPFFINRKHFFWVKSILPPV